jgi:trigger factor
MKTSLLKKEKGFANFEIVFEASELEDAEIKAYKANKDKYDVHGFRKGKAPRKIIEQHYGKGIFLEDAINDLVADSYPKALADLDIEPIDRPDMDFSGLEPGKGFTVKVKVATPPEFEIKDYEGVEVDEIKWSVPKADIDAQLDGLRQRNSRKIDTGKVSKDGDTVNIDYKGFDGEKQFEGGTAQGYDLVLGSGSFIPGFEEQLIGKLPGDETDVNVSFPKEYHSKELAGKPVVFKVKVNSVKMIELPELNDEFAKDISEFDTLEELKKSEKAKLEESAKLQAENTQKNQALERVYEANDIDIPEVMVETAIDDIINEMEQTFKQQGMDLDTYFKYMGKDISEYRKEIRGDAYKRVKMRLIVKAISEAQGFKADEKEIEEELTRLAGLYNMDVDQLKPLMGEDQLSMLASDIKNRKAVEFVYTSAIVRPAKKEATKKPAAKKSEKKVK